MRYAASGQPLRPRARGGAHRRGRPRSACHKHRHQTWQVRTHELPRPSQSRDDRANRPRGTNDPRRDGTQQSAQRGTVAGKPAEPASFAPHRPSSSSRDHAIIVGTDCPRFDIECLLMQSHAPQPARRKPLRPLLGQDRLHPCVILDGLLAKQANPERPQRERKRPLPQLLTHIVHVALRATGRNRPQGIRGQPQPQRDLRNGRLQSLPSSEERDRNGQPSWRSGPSALLNTWSRLCVENPRLTFSLRVVMSQSRQRFSSFLRMSSLSPGRPAVA